MTGTGIGLVVTKQLAELMDGQLGVDSTAGSGSDFWVEMRSCAAPDLLMGTEQSAAPEQVQLAGDLQQFTVLYVEDNPANMTLVERILARRGDIRLLTAVNGMKGIEDARNQQPDVILMDINLPGISGTEALKILRDDPLTAHIPVLALSANAMSHDIALGMELGFFRYLTKPIQVTTFMDTLNVALAFAQSSASKTPTESFLATVLKPAEHDGL